MPDTTKAIAASKVPAPAAALKLVPPRDLFQRVQQLQDEIARRAFAIFESNGRSLGRELDDWFKAESELFHPVHVDVSESNGALIVKAEVPGFTAKELDIALEPNRLTITGSRKTKEERKDKKTIYTESCSNRLLKVIDLPAAVETEKAAAILRDGILELKIPKAPPAKKVQIATKESKPDEQC